MGPEQELIISCALLVAVVLAALWTVMTARIVYTAVGLALTSGIIAILMFMMKAPIAGVFELSVCAGLIPAVFLSAISVAKRLTPETALASAREQIKTFWSLPVLMALIGIVLMLMNAPEFTPKAAAVEPDVRTILWNLRHMDVLGQIVILLAGAFAVVVLLKESRNG